MSLTKDGYYFYIDLTLQLIWKLTLAWLVFLSAPLKIAVVLPVPCGYYVRRARVWP